MLSIPFIDIIWVSKLFFVLDLQFFSNKHSNFVKNSFFLMPPKNVVSYKRLLLWKDLSKIEKFFHCAWFCLRVKKCGSTELKCCFIFFLLTVRVRHARHSTNSRTLNVHSKKIMSQAKNERFSDSCKIDKRFCVHNKTSHTYALQPWNAFIISFPFHYTEF